MKIEYWVREIKKAYLQTNRKLSEEEKLSLMIDAIGESYELEQAGLTPSYVKPIFRKFFKDGVEILTSYFFKKASAGETFGNIARIKEQFGNTLEKNYGLHSGPFFNLAKTYWTFKIEVADLFPIHNQKLISQILAKVEFDIAKIFFPTPGVINIPVELRKKAQRRMLERYMPGADVESFLSNNPILKTKKYF